MHIAKKNKNNYIKRKFCYSDKFLVTATLTPPRQHQKSNISKSEASKKETVHKRHRRLIIYIRLLLWRKVHAYKTRPSTRQLLGTTN
jgi:hypothetical protein